MKDLELLGMHPDGTQLILNDTDGERYTLPITQDLRDLLGAYQPFISAVSPVQSGNLQPSQIQSMIRAGQTTEQIAKQYNLPAEQIRRYERPILAERQFYAQKAQNCRIGTEPDSPTLGDLTLDRLAARGVDPTQLRWDAIRQGKNPWQVRLTFVQGAKELTATWQMEANATSVMALDEEAIWLSETRRPGQISQDYIQADGNGENFQELANLAPHIHTDQASLSARIGEDNVRSFVKNNQLDTLEEDLKFGSSKGKPDWSEDSSTQALLDYLDQARGQRGQSLPGELLDEEDDLDYARLAELANTYDLGDLDGLTHEQLKELLAQDEAGTLEEQLANSENLANGKYPSSERLAGRIESTTAKIISFTRNAFLGEPEGDPEEIVRAAVEGVLGKSEAEIEEEIDAKTGGDDQNNAIKLITTDDATVSVPQVDTDSDSGQLEKPLDQVELVASETSDNDPDLVQADCQAATATTEAADFSNQEVPPTLEVPELSSVEANELGIELETDPETLTTTAGHIEADRTEKSESESKVTEQLEETAVSDQNQAQISVETDSSKSEKNKQPTAVLNEDADDQTTMIAQVQEERTNHVLPGMEKLPGPVVPLGEKEPLAPEANPPTEEVQVVDENQLILPPPSKRKKKNKRQSVPSWDEIVFGAKPR